MPEPKDIAIDRFVENLKLNYHQKRQEAYWLLKDTEDPTDFKDISHDLEQVIKTVIEMMQIKATIANVRMLRESLSE